MEMQIVKLIQAEDRIVARSWGEGGGMEKVKVKWYKVSVSQDK